MNTKTQPLTIGDTYTTNSDRDWTADDGTKVTHRFVVRAQVISTNEVGFEADVIEVLAEEGRPTFANPSSAPFHFSTAWFGWDAAVARGDSRKDG